MKHLSTWFAGFGALTIAAILALAAGVSRGNQKLTLSQTALSNASTAVVAADSFSKLQPATDLRSARPVSAPGIPVSIKAPTSAGLPPVSGLKSPARPAGVVQPYVQSYGKLPLSFEASQGQTDARVQFLSRGRGYSLFLTGDEAVLKLKKPAVAVSRQSSAVSGQLPGITKPGQRTTDHGPRTVFLE